MRNLMVLTGCVVTVVACGSDPGTDPTSTGSTTGVTSSTGSGAGGDTGTGGGATTTTTGAGAGGSGAGAPMLTSQAQIDAYLDGKTLTMEGNDIPTDPNGFNENVDFGPNTQCYNRSTLELNGATFTVTSDLGTLENIDPNTMVGTCDRTNVSNTLMFNSQSHVFENVQGNAECFDVTFTYNGFAQEGRGSISADGLTVSFELFFVTQATGIRCADGAVGSGGITLAGNAFTGDAVQVYRVTED